MSDQEERVRELLEAAFRAGTRRCGYDVVPTAEELDALFAGAHLVMQEQMDEKLAADKTRAYALGRAHGQYRTTPTTHDWACARAWMATPDLEECSDNPDRNHEYVTAQDGDGQPMDYQHCGYCGKRRPS